MLYNIYIYYYNPNYDKIAQYQRYAFAKNVNFLALCEM